MRNQDTTDSPVARTISVIGSSWTCLILRDFFLHGPRRFQDLQDSLKGIAPATLSERLRTLEENGVVERRFYSMSPPRAEYVLTAKDRDHTAVTSAREPASNLIFQETKRMLRPSIKRRIVGIATGMIILAVITSVMSMALASRVGHLLDELTNRYIPAYADLARVDIRS